ncbi:MAG: hydroxyacid dehydrogenase [Candidatus Anstonellales archaeon]
MPTIVVADEMEEDVLEMLSGVGKIVYKPSNIGVALTDADALVVRSATRVTRELVENCKKLKVVARAGVGLDNIDIESCEKKGIKVFNTPGSSTEAVAELTIGLMICACRNVGKAHFGMKNGKWEKKKLTGFEIEGKTLGIIGYGRIGKAVAEKAVALGMRVIASDPTAKNDAYARIVSFQELLKESDIISLHCNLTDATKGMINKEAIEMMRNGVVILNLARGELINEDALYDGCKSGKIYAVALDVYSAEPYKGKLLELDNIIFTPHIGASTQEAQKKIGVELVHKLKQELG